jgi:hypothetical protein
MSPMTEGPHRELMLRAIAAEGDGHRAALGGDAEAAHLAYQEATELYRASWEVAPPASYGRLEGMLKAAVLAGDATEAAAYVRAQLATEEQGEASPPAAYALAVAALVRGDDAEATRLSERMRPGSPAFGRAADAVAALAAADAGAYRAAVAAIVADFTGREEHLTGVAIADTAAMLEALAGARGLAAALDSPLLP